MQTDSDAGFGIVEIIVSMLMLAIIAIALAPVIIGGVRSTAKMSTLATATQMVNDGLETQRASLGACPDPMNPPAALAATDARKIALQGSITYPNGATCVRPYLLTVEISVSTVAATALFPAGKVLATATTLVYIP